MASGTLAGITDSGYWDQFVDPAVGNNPLQYTIPTYPYHLSNTGEVIDPGTDPPAIAPDTSTMNAQAAADQAAAAAAATAQRQIAGPQTAAGGDFGQFWLSTGGRTVADLQAAVQQWNASHPADQVTLGGSKGDKATYRGRTYDAVLSAGAGGLGATWNDITNGGSSGGALSGTLLDPYTKQYQLPTLDQLHAMPGWQAGLDAAQRAVQTGAAARGTLLTGGTQKALQRSAINYADQSYSTLANLGLNEFNTNYGIFRNNQTDPFNKLSTLAQITRPPA